MQTPSSLPAEWPDLPNFRARRAPLLDGLGQCAITEDGEDRVTLLLPADGLVALIDAPKDPVSEHLLLALGRVVAEHARASTSRLHPAVILTEPPASRPPERALYVGVANIAGRISNVGRGIFQCRLHTSGEAALVFLMQDGVMPLVWANFSTPVPADQLLVAVAGLLIAHRTACVEGRDL